MVEEEIKEFAVVFKRVKSNYELVEEFIPYKVVEGYYCEQEESFVDTEQNVYSHMASLAEIGNVYAGRKPIYDVININPHRTYLETKAMILESAKKYSYYKNIDDSSNSFSTIKIKNNETGELSQFTDRDTSYFYNMFNPDQEEMDEDEEELELVEITADEIETGKEKNSEENIHKYNAPIEIVDEVKRTVKGQDAAIETIVTLLWMKRYEKIPKSNILLIGPTGVGKTIIFEKLQKILNVPLTIYNATGNSQAGFVGHDIEEMLLQLYYDSEKDIERAQNGIVLLDEFDKLSSSNNRDSGNVGTTGVQKELLKLIEGYKTNVQINNHQSFNIDTSNIVFVCCGAFQDLFEENKERVVGFNSNQGTKKEKKKVTTKDIIDYGIIRELAGRLPFIIQLNDLNNRPDILKDILFNSDESVFTATIETLKEEGIEIENLDELIDTIVNDAMNKKIGARGLISPVKNMFVKIFYEINNNPGKYEKVILGKNIVEDNNDYILIPKKVKRRTKQIASN